MKKHEFYNPIRHVRPTQRMIKAEAERKARRAHRWKVIKEIVGIIIGVIIFVAFFYVWMGLAVAYNM